MTEAQDALTQVEAATRAEDLFGRVEATPPARRAAKRRYRSWLPLLHPDRSVATGLDPDRATAALATLTGLYEQWTLAAADPGTPTRKTAPQVAVTGQRGTYLLGAVVGTGSAHTLYSAEGPQGTVTVKMPRQPSSGRHTEAERSALEALARLSGEHDWLAPYYPHLLDHGTHLASGSGQRRPVNILDDLSPARGFVTLAAVRDAYPHGLDGRDWAWMFRRLLKALAGAHLAGLVHGAVLADNVLIHPEHHGVVLAGWSFATTEGGPLPGMVGSAKAAYPPEALASQPVSGKTDVFMAATLMRTMLRPGETRQRAFVDGCTQPTATMRPDAAQLIDDYDFLLDGLYGPRRFRPFHLPATVAGGDRKETHHG